MTREYVDIKEIMKDTKAGDVLVLDFPCGSGKTTSIVEFAKENKNKRILQLSPRKTLRKQNDEMFGGCDNVTCMTIQALAHIGEGYTYNGYEKRLNLYDSYDYIFLDEGQSSLVLDSAFNTDIVMISDDIVAKFVNKERGVLVCLTGTDVGLERYFELAYGIKCKAYHQKDTINFLKDDTFHFIRRGNSVTQIIKEKIANGEKVLFFSGTIRAIEELKMRFEDQTLAVVSKGAPYYNRICGGQEKDIATLIEEERLPDKYTILAATKAMDVGVSIHDSSITTVICDTLELATMRQMIARKRLEENEKIDLYVVLPDNRTLAQRKRRFEERYEFYQLYMENPKMFISQVAGKRLDTNELVFPAGNTIDGSLEWKIDFPAVVYTEYMLDTTLKRPKVYAYQECVSEMLGCQGVVLPSTPKTIESFVGMKLPTKADKMKLATELGVFKSPKLLNKMLEENNLPYRILDKQYMNLGRDKDGKLRQTNRAWMLVRI